MNEKLIDRYLLNLLSMEEKKSFELQLENDESFRDELIHQQSLIENIEGIGRIELKTKLQILHKKLDLDSKSPPTNIRTLFFRIVSAAIFIGIIAFGWIWMQKTPTSTELFAQNFEPFELSLVQRSEGDQTYTNIESLYVEGNYSQAIPLFQNVLNGREVKSSQILLGLGVSYLKTNQPTMAVDQFKNILDNKDFNFEDEAQWYLGLSYLKLNDLEKAKYHFNILASDSKRDHSQDSQQIMSQLK